MTEHGGPPTPSGGEGTPQPRHRAPTTPRAGEPVPGPAVDLEAGPALARRPTPGLVPGPRHAAPVPPIPGPRHAAPGPSIPGPRPPVERSEPTVVRPSTTAPGRVPPPFAPPRHALRPPAYTPPIPDAPRSRVPAWVLPASLCAVIALSGAGIVGVGAAALAANRADTTAAAAGDRDFLGALATRPSLRAIPEDDLIDLGHGICSALEDGSSQGELVSGAVSAGFSTRDARLLVEAANAAYCPSE